MNRRMVRILTPGSLSLVFMLIMAWQALAQDAKVQYPSMAPLDQYLMTDRNAENSPGAKCSSGGDIKRRRGFGPRPAWL